MPVRIDVRAPPMVGAREPDGPGLQGLRRARHRARPARRGRCAAPSGAPWPASPAPPRSWCARDMRESGVELARRLLRRRAGRGGRRDRPRHGLDRLLVLRLGPPRRAGRHVHGVAQPGAVQRHQDVPLRRAPDRARHRPGRHRGRWPRSCWASRSGRSPAAGASSTCSASGRTTSVSFVDVSALRPLKVVADTANGMGGLVVPIVFDRLPFSVEILFPELDGTFPNHPADPIQPENLVAPEAGRRWTRAPTSAWPSTGTPTGSSSSTRRPSRSRVP